MVVCTVFEAGWAILTTELDFTPAVHTIWLQ